MLTTKCLDCAFCVDDDEALYCDKGNNETCVTASPLCWIGGKFYLANKLIPLFPEHVTYVEVFGGTAHVLFKKTPSKVEIYNDIDDRLVNFFEVIQDKEKNEQLQKMLTCTLYARSIFNQCKSGESLRDVDKAYDFAVINKQSFGAKMGTWGVDVIGNGQVKAFNNLPGKIAQAFIRMKDVQIENSGFEYILKRYDRSETFFYLDPPYAFNGARGKDKIYKHDMSDADHERLVDCLLLIKGKAMLSGYDTPLYERLVNSGWRKVGIAESNISLQLKKDAARQKKQEFVWVNY